MIVPSDLWDQRPCSLLTLHSWSIAASALLWTTTALERTSDFLLHPQNYNCWIVNSWDTSALICPFWEEFCLLCYQQRFNYCIVAWDTFALSKLSIFLDSLSECSSCCWLLANWVSVSLVRTIAAAFHPFWAYRVDLYYVYVVYAADPACFFSSPCCLLYVFEA